MLTIARNGITMWYGQQIGRTEKIGKAWMFTPNVQCRVRGVVHGRVLADVRSELEHKIKAANADQPQI